MTIGIVYYADDPFKRVFRRVFLQEGETEAAFDDPQWTTLGVDPARKAVLERVSDDATFLSGTVDTKADDPLPSPSPPFDTPDERVEEILSQANVGPNDTLVDLGSGAGAFLIGAAKRGARAIGIDTDAAAVEHARNRAAAAGLTVEVRQEDFYQADLSAATVVTINLGIEPEGLTYPKGCRIVLIDGDNVQTRNA